MWFSKEAWNVFDRIVKVLFFLAGALIAFFVLAVCWDVIARSLLGQPLRWVVEFSEYGLLFITFLGTAWVLRSEGHVSIDIVLAHLNSSKRALLIAAMSLVGAIVCAFLVYWGGYVGYVSIDHLQRGLYQATTMEVPDFPLFMIIPIGSLLLLIQFLRRMHDNLRMWKEARSRSSK